jgi:hypothetical protein
VADAKISALAAAAAALGTHEFAVNEAGASKKVTSAQVKTLVNTAPAFAAGSATAGSWPTLASGTLLTTPEDGALEFDADCFYATTDAGNRGVVAVRHIIRADATRTFSSVTTSQAIFTSPANGRLTLETGTYIVEGVLMVTAMSATSGNALVNLLGAGTATTVSLVLDKPWYGQPCGHGVGGRWRRLNLVVIRRPGCSGGYGHSHDGPDPWLVRGDGSWNDHSVAVADDGSGCCFANRLLSFVRAHRLDYDGLCGTVGLTWQRSRKSRPTLTECRRLSSGSGLRGFRRHGIF